MKADEAVAAIQQYFAANWATTQVAYGNEPPVERVEPFIRLSVQVGDSMPNLDSTYTRTVGLAMISARVPKGAGDLSAWTLAQNAADVIQLKSIGTVPNKIRLTSAGFVDAGIIGDALETDAGWYQVNANVPFWFERHF